PASRRDTGSNAPCSGVRLLLVAKEPDSPPAASVATSAAPHQNRRASSPVVPGYDLSTSCTYRRCCPARVVARSETRAQPPSIHLTPRGTDHACSRTSCEPLNGRRRVSMLDQDN